MINLTWIPPSLVASVLLKGKKISNTINSFFILYGCKYCWKNTFLIFFRDILTE